GKVRTRSSVAAKDTRKCTVGAWMMVHEENKRALRDDRGRKGSARSAFPLHGASPRVYTEPYGSVYAGPPRCLVRRTLGHHPTRRSGAARAFRRFDHGSCREVPDDPHGHEEARRRLGAGRARHHGESRARADLQARPAPTGGRDGVDRQVPPTLGRTLRRVGQGCRGTETEGEDQWTQEERVSPPPSRTARWWNGSPSVS